MENHVGKGCEGPQTHQKHKYHRESSSRPEREWWRKWHVPDRFVIVETANSPATSTRCRVDASWWVSNLNLHFFSWFGRVWGTQNIFG